MKNFFLIFYIACAFLPAASLAQSAAPEALLASDVDVPSRPTPPVPPTVSNLRKGQPDGQKEPAHSFPAPFKQQENNPLPQQPLKTANPAKEEKNAGQTAKKHAEQTKETGENTSPQEILQEAFPETKDAEKKPTAEAEKEKNSLSLPQQLGYTAAMAALIGLTAYLYTTTPQASRKTRAASLPKKTRRPSFSAPYKENCAEKRKQKLPPPTNPINPLQSAGTKIKNTSLLEQLVKYDMETYGRLRSNLDYEQPAYVEKLIKKYGNGDQAKINRAINAFYQSRNKS